MARLQGMNRWEGGEQEEAEEQGQEELAPGHEEGHEKC